MHNLGDCGFTDKYHETKRSLAEISAENSELKAINETLEKSFAEACLNFNKGLANAEKKAEDLRQLNKRVFEQLKGIADPPTLNSKRGWSKVQYRAAMVNAQLSARQHEMSARSILSVMNAKFGTNIQYTPGMTFRMETPPEQGEVDAIQVILPNVEDKKE
jgi:hypothetical protein